MGRGVLDAPPEPVIRRRFAPTGWRGMTALLVVTFARHPVQSTNPALSPMLPRITIKITPQQL
jgi:hypothetical protein